MLLHSVLIALTVHWFICTVRGQTTEAVCRSTYSWMSNSLDQSPCLVAAYAQGACTTNGNWDVPAITDSTFTYAGPYVDQATLCTCSSVSFNLLSACASTKLIRYFTQMGPLDYKLFDKLDIEWTISLANSTRDCHSYMGISSSSEDVASSDLPDSTAPAPSTILPSSTSASIPSSALSSLTTPETSSTSTPFTSASSTPAPTTSGPQSSPSSESTLPPSPSSSLTSHSSHIGAIVGGAVGGAAGALLIIAGMFIVLRGQRARSSSEVPPQEATFREAFVVQPEASPTLTLPVSEPPMTPMKLYNPDDPSTFPPNIPELP
ncbi:hypothetical protein NM688_g4181 [Phlebia brevispora]|uniref:Uncharacterized protein n=1 Tax=Phlebia brevispora TaxID=194682 RepID=A0ACC1T3T2_9APHY|nr:hypothetical protein NM688_g4181 [Phlebia brevispora]